MFTTEDFNTSDLHLAVQMLTPEDVKEVRCQDPSGNLLGMLMEYKYSCLNDPQRYTMRMAFSPDGWPLLVGGWDKLLGVAWFLTTVEAMAYPSRVYKAVLECREMALKDCPQLFNKVMKTNRAHVRLLEAIGAEFIGPIEPIGGEPFQAFIITRKE